MYWTIAHQYKLWINHPVYFPANFGIHGFIAILLMIEFCFNNRVISTRTLKHGSYYGFIYMLFNCAWTKTFYPIYPVLKWDSVLSIYFALATTVLLVGWWIVLIML
jgi:hypothetical protein